MDAVCANYRVKRLPPAASYVHLQWIDIDEHACDGGDRASEQKSDQAGKGQQGQSTPWIARPVIQPLGRLTNVGLQTGGLEPSHGIGFRGKRQG